MYLIRLLLVAALSVTALSKRAQPSAYETYFKKQSSSTPINLDERQFADLTTGQRDYHAAVVLTALDAKYACTICRAFDPEWKIVANSWKKSDKRGNNRMLFGTLDFEKGRNVFISVKTLDQTAKVLAGTNSSLDAITDSTSSTAVSAHGRRECVGGRSAQAIRLPSTSNSRGCAELDRAQSSPGRVSCHRSTVRLRQACDHHHACRGHPHRGGLRLPVCIAHCTEPKFMGSIEPDHGPHVHQRTYVQPHSKGAIHYG